jgi:16S rRNA (guanine966-N2)-methyltransferase
MRIVAGRNRGVRLRAPSGRGVRPTSDKVREAMFQIAESRYGIEWDGASFLDLFAGAGTLGLEAVSRGASRAVFIESSARHVRTIADNINTCGVEGQGRVFRAAIPIKTGVMEKVMGYAPFRMIAADPPYSKGLGVKALEQAADYALLADGGVLVIEEFYREVLPETCKGEKATLALCDTRKYGQTVLWFYQVKGR